MAQCEKREEFSAEELGVEGLGGGSWLLQVFLGDGDNERTGERRWSLLHDDCAVEIGRASCRERVFLSV